MKKPGNVHAPAPSTRIAGRFIALSLLFAPLFVLASGSTAWAQSADCDSLTDGGERLKCKHQKLIVQQERLVGNMKFHYSGDIDDKILQRLERAHLRAKAKGERMDAKAFKRLAKKSKLICETKEWIDPNGPVEGDQDGVCEANEPCEEVIGDQIGDDIQPCTSRGKHKEECVQICGDTSASANRMLWREEVLVGAEDETDPELLAEMEESFEDMAGQMEDLNIYLEDNAANFAVIMETARAAGAASSACVYSTDWQSVVIPILSFTKTVNAVTRGGADVAERFCDQTAFGTNTAAICAVIEGVVSVVNIAVTGFEGVVAGLEANLQDDTGYCLQDMSGNLNDVVANVANPNGTLALMDADLRAIHFNTVDPNGDLAVIKESSLQSSGNSVLMVDALNDHDAALTVHGTALANHDGALTTHDAAAQASLAALAESQALLHQEANLSFELDIEESLSRPDSCVPTLWLPLAHGGKMELVRNHVAKLVQGAISSGDPSANTSGAANHLAAADVLIAAGQYRKACHKLTRAIQALR